MLYGLEKFKEYFKDYTNQYVFIGGTACDILMQEIGVEFRATKDLDIVLIIEALDVSFVEVFWKFINDGAYKSCQMCSNNNNFYRFSQPYTNDFPKMIELFSRLPDNLELKKMNRLTPIHIDDSIVSLSAILLDDIYYEALINGKRNIDGYSVIEIETVILFKIKAWLDMKQRKENGAIIDSKNIRKHKNDIFRLLVNVLPTSEVIIPIEILNDVTQFIEMIKLDKPDLKNLRINQVDFDELIELLNSIYKLKKV